jgi:phosphoenolpyruvate phosphomutase
MPTRGMATLTTCAASCASCIEDKLFPKTNSLLEGALQPMAEIDEFVGKIKAAKDTQQDPDFCVVARTEAFISGHGLGEALRRAEAYSEAGADALVIHSKLSTADQVLAFMAEWQGDTRSRPPIGGPPRTPLSRLASGW